MFMNPSFQKRTIIEQHGDQPGHPGGKRVPGSFHSLQHEMCVSTRSTWLVGYLEL